MSGEPGAMGGHPGPGRGEGSHAEPVTPPSSDATSVNADAGAIPPAETGATAAAVPEAGGGVVQVPQSAEAAAEVAADAAVATAPANAGTADAGTIAAPVRRPRRLAAKAGLTRLARFAVMLALLSIGVAIGYQTFLGSQPGPTGPVADPATAGNLPTPVVRELIAAIGRNDADAIRSAVPATPYKALTAEMARWEIHEVTKVETLATYEDGQRTATAFVIIGRKSSNNPVAINLIVETQAGNIVGFK